MIILYYCRTFIPFQIQCGEIVFELNDKTSNVVN